MFLFLISDIEPLFLYALRDLVVNCDDYFVGYMKEKLEFFEVGIFSC